MRRNRFKTEADREKLVADLDDAGQISTPIAENDNTDVLVDRELVPEGPAPVPDKQEQDDE